MPTSELRKLMEDIERRRNETAPLKIINEVTPSDPVKEKTPEPLQIDKEALEASLAEMQKLQRSYVDTSDMGAFGKTIEFISRPLRKAMDTTPGRFVQNVSLGGARQILGDSEYGKDFEVSTGSEGADKIAQTVGGFTAPIAMMSLHGQPVGQAVQQTVMANPNLWNVNPNIISALRNIGTGVATMGTRDALSETFNPTWKDYAGSAAYMGLAGPVSSAVAPHVQYMAPGIHPLLENLASSFAGGLAGSVASLPFSWSDLEGEGFQKATSALKKVGVDAGTYALFGTMMMALQPEMWGDRSPQMKSAANNMMHSYNKYLEALQAENKTEADKYAKEFQRWGNTFFHYARQVTKQGATSAGGVQILDKQAIDAMKLFGDVDPNTITPENFRQVLDMKLQATPWSAKPGLDASGIDSGSDAPSATQQVRPVPTQTRTTSAPVSDTSTPTLATVSRSLVDSLRAFQGASEQNQGVALEEFIQAGNDFKNYVQGYDSLNEHPERNQFVQLMNELNMNAKDFISALQIHGELVNDLANPYDDIPIIEKSDSEVSASNVAEVQTEEPVNIALSQENLPEYNKQLRRFWGSARGKGLTTEESRAIWTMASGKESMKEGSADDFQRAINLLSNQEFNAKEVAQHLLAQQQPDTEVPTEQPKAVVPDAELTSTEQSPVETVQAVDEPNLASGIENSEINLVKPENVDELQRGDTVYDPHGKEFEIVRINKNSFRVKNAEGLETTLAKSVIRVGEQLPETATTEIAPAEQTEPQALGEEMVQVDQIPDVEVPGVESPVMDSETENSAINVEQPDIPEYNIRGTEPTDETGQGATLPEPPITDDGGGSVSLDGAAQIVELGQARKELLDWAKTDEAQSISERANATVRDLAYQDVNRVIKDIENGLETKEAALKLYDIVAKRMGLSEETQRINRERIAKAEPPKVMGERPIVEPKGKESVAFTPKQIKVETKFEVVPVSDLLTSDMDGYPKELQPRQRERRASREQINKIKRELNPELLGHNPHAADGSPIVNKQLINETGNGRTIAIREIAKENPEKYKMYKQWIIDNAEKFGIEPSDVEAIENPILVRVRTNELDDVVEFVRDANERTTLEMSAVEQALVDADELTHDIMSLFVPNESGRIDTRANDKFVVAFFDKIIGTAEKGKYVTDDGKLNADGHRRIQASILAKAYGENATLLSSMLEELDDNIKRVSVGLLSTASKYADLKEGIAKGQYHDLDITHEIAEAANKLSQLRDDGISVEDYLQQMQFPGMEDLSPLSRLILSKFDEFAGRRGSQQKMVTFLSNYARLVELAGSPNQMQIPGLEQDPPTREELIEAASSPRAMGIGTEQMDLFPSEGSGSVEEGLQEYAQDRSQESKGVGESTSPQPPERESAEVEASKEIDERTPKEIIRDLDNKLAEAGYRREGSSIYTLAKSRFGPTKPIYTMENKNWRGMVKEIEELLERGELQELEKAVENSKVELPIDVSPDDLPYEETRRAYSLSSMVPEERAREDQITYVREMEDLYQKLAPLAKTDEQKVLLAEELELYKEGYLQKMMAILNAKSKTASVMVTGRANFNTARNQKALEAERRRTEEFLDWRDKARKSIERKLTDSAQRSSQQPEPSTIEQEDRVGKQLFHRFSNKESPLSDLGHAMFALNPDDVSGYGKNHFIYDGKDGVNIYDIYDNIVEAWERDKELGYFGEWGGSNDIESAKTISGEEIADGFIPANIVDSAENWDIDLTQWIWERVLEPQDIHAVYWDDGAIVFDPDLIQKVERGKEKFIESQARFQEIDQEFNVEKIVTKAIDSAQTELVATMMDAVETIGSLPQEYDMRGHIVEQVEMLLGENPGASEFHGKSPAKLRAWFDNYKEIVAGALEDNEDITKEEAWEAAKKEIRMNLQFFGGKKDEGVNEWEEFFGELATGESGASTETSPQAIDSEETERAAGIEEVINSPAVQKLLSIGKPKPVSELKKQTPNAKDLKKRIDSELEESDNDISLDPFAPQTDDVADFFATNKRNWKGKNPSEDDPEWLKAKKLRSKRIWEGQPKQRVKIPFSDKELRFVETPGLWRDEKMLGTPLTLQYLTGLSPWDVVGNEITTLGIRANLILHSVNSSVQNEIEKWAEGLTPEQKHELALMMDGQRPITPELAKQAEFLRNEILDKYRTDFGIGGYIPDYMPHVAVDSIDDLLAKQDEALAKQLEGVPGALDYFARHPRTDPDSELMFEDAFEAVSYWFYRGLKATVMDEFLHAIEDAKEIADPSRHKWLDEYGKMVIGVPGSEETFFNNLVAFAIGDPDYKGRHIKQVVDTFTELWYDGAMMWNLHSPIKNLTQKSLTIGYLSDGANPAKGVYYWAKGVQMLTTKTGRELLKYSEVLNDRQFLEGIGEREKVLAKFFKPYQKFSEWGWKPYKLSDLSNVSEAYLAGVYKGLERGLSLEEAIRYGDEVVKNTQYTYGTSGLMLFKGPFSRMLGVVNSWPLNWMRLNIAMLQGKGTLPPKAKGEMRKVLEGLEDDLKRLDEEFGEIDSSFSSRKEASGEDFDFINPGESYEDRFVTINGRKYSKFGVLRVGQTMVAMSLMAALFQKIFGVNFKSTTPKEVTKSSLPYKVATGEYWSPPHETLGKMLKSLESDNWDQLEEETKNWVLETIDSFVPASNARKRVSRVAEDILNEYWAEDKKHRQVYEKTPWEATRQLWGTPVERYERQNISAEIKSVYLKHFGLSEGKQASRQAFKKDLTEALTHAQKLGYTKEGIEKMAKNAESAVRSSAYNSLWEALEKRDQKEAYKAAMILAGSGANASTIRSSAKNRGIQPQLTNEALHLFNKAKAQIK